MHKQKSIDQNSTYSQQQKIAIFQPKQKKRKQDSIIWVVSGLGLFTFCLISVARITVIGQFFDDLFFNYLFGWTKYLVYLVLFCWSVQLFFNFKYKFTFKFKLIVFISFILFAIFISLVLLTVLFAQNKIVSSNQVYKVESLWQANLFKQLIGFYNHTWYEHSVFSDNYFTKTSDYLINHNGYFNLYLGSGITGFFSVAILWYFSLPGAYVVYCVLLLLFVVWVFTGDWLKLFKFKNKKSIKALRFFKSAVKNSSINQQVVVDEQNSNDLNFSNTKQDDWDSLQAFNKRGLNNSDLIIELPIYSNFEPEKLKNFEIIWNDKLKTNNNNQNNQEISKTNSNKLAQQVNDYEGLINWYELKTKTHLLDNSFFSDDNFTFNN
ncbi:hypothetical protein V2P24_01200 [Mycoplasma putrefaciens]|uniref:hypothetical protein n=1 Tax=Mycoplasma putrefaciens TaxID=2123 RepID=UPI003DA3559B